MEDGCNGRRRSYHRKQQRQLNIEKDEDGKQRKWMTMNIENDENGRGGSWKK